MKKILMYSGPMCNFCEAAKRLLDRNNLKYEVIDISSGDGIREEMINKSNGKRTIPQIFFDDHHIGYARTEYHCKNCGGHHGHIFEDGPNPTGKRYCNNGICLIFKPKV